MQAIHFLQYRPAVLLPLALSFYFTTSFQAPASIACACFYCGVEWYSTCACALHTVPGMYHTYKSHSHVSYDTLFSFCYPSHLRAIATLFVRACAHLLTFASSIVFALDRLSPSCSPRVQNRRAATACLVSKPPARPVRPAARSGATNAEEKAALNAAFRNSPVNTAALAVSSITRAIALTPGLLRASSRVSGRISSHILNFVCREGDTCIICAYDTRQATYQFD